MGSVPRLGRSPGEGNGNPLQYSCLENPAYKGAWRATVYGVAKTHDWSDLAQAQHKQCNSMLNILKLFSKVVTPFYALFMFIAE